MPFRGSVADSKRGEMFINIIGIVCACGYGIDLFHARYICGETFRLGVRCEDGNLDTTGYKGGTADMIYNGTRLAILNKAPQLINIRRNKRMYLFSLLRSNREPLIKAVQIEMEKVVISLIALGVSLDLVDNQGRTIIFSAINVPILKRLLDGKFENEGGVSIDIQDNFGSTALMIMSNYITLGDRYGEFNSDKVSCLRRDMVSLLLERGASMTLRDKWDYTVWDYAMRSRSANGLMIKLLCERRDRSTTGAEYIAIEEDRRRAIHTSKVNRRSHHCWHYSMTHYWN